MSGSGSGVSRRLVVDTSVAVKWHLPEEGHEEALKLFAAIEGGEVALIAPSGLRYNGASSPRDSAMH